MRDEWSSAALPAIGEDTKMRTEVMAPIGNSPTPCSASPCSSSGPAAISASPAHRQHLLVQRAMLGGASSPSPSAAAVNGVGSCASSSGGAFASPAAFSSSPLDHLLLKMSMAGASPEATSSRTPALAHQHPCLAGGELDGSHNFTKSPISRGVVSGFPPHNSYGSGGGNMHRYCPGFHTPHHRHHHSPANYRRRRFYSSEALMKPSFESPKLSSFKSWNHSPSDPTNGNPYYNNENNDNELVDSDDKENANASSNGNGDLVPDQLCTNGVMIPKCHRQRTQSENNTKATSSFVNVFDSSPKYRSNQEEGDDDDDDDDEYLGEQEHCCGHRNHDDEGSLGRSLSRSRSRSLSQSLSRSHSQLLVQSQPQRRNSEESSSSMYSGSATSHTVSRSLSSSEEKLSVEKLLNLQKLFQEGFITVTEFKARRQQLVNELTVTDKSKMDCGDMPIVYREPPDFTNLPERDAIKHVFDIDNRKWTSSPIRVKIDEHPFARGGLRKVYHIQDCTALHENNCLMASSSSPLNADSVSPAGSIRSVVSTGSSCRNSSLGAYSMSPAASVASTDETYCLASPTPKRTSYVAKIAIDPNENADTYFRDVEMQAMAAKYAKLYNSYNPPRRVEFLEAWILQLIPEKQESEDWTLRGTICGVEPFIAGEYHKHNNNFGYVSELERNTPQAFSHFTYEASGREILIVDIQGVGDHYTDPQIHTRTGKEFGKGNLSVRGFERFLESHRCNPICRYLRLPLNNPKENQGTIPAQTYMSKPQVDRVESELCHYYGNSNLFRKYQAKKKNHLLAMQQKQQKSRLFFSPRQLGGGTGSSASGGGKGMSPRCFGSPNAELVLGHLKVRRTGSESDGAGVKENVNGSAKGHGQFVRELRKNADFSSNGFDFSAMMERKGCTWCGMSACSIS